MKAFPREGRYEGDPVIGHRLYREIGKTYYKQKEKGKGCVEPKFESQWETIAINLEEFPGIMDSLSSSNIPEEAFVGETIKTLPVFKRIEKKKAQQERLARRLESCLNCRVGPTRSCRDRRPVRYTFEEYDRSIDEAIRITMDPNYVEEENSKEEQYMNGFGKEHPSSNGKNMDTLNEISRPNSSEVNTDAKNCNNHSDYDDADDDYGYNDGTVIDENDDDYNDDTIVSDSDKENMKAPLKPALEEKHVSVKLVAGLRRSSRNLDAHQAVTRKRLRQRPTKNAGYSEVIISSDSEDENPAKCAKQTTAVDLSSIDGSPVPIV